jgi:hypothetical protein
LRVLFNGEAFEHSFFLLQEVLLKVSLPGEQFGRRDGVPLMLRRISWE